MKNPPEGKYLLFLATCHGIEWHSSYKTLEAAIDAQDRLFENDASKAMEAVFVIKAESFRFKL